MYLDGRESHASREELYQHPALDRLRTAAKAGAFDRVYVNSVERLSGDPIHVGIVLMELKAAGVEVAFVTEPVDFDTPEGQIIAAIKAYAGKAENERKRERQMRAITARAAKGLPIRGCRPPYGFAWGPERDAEGHPTYERLVFDEPKATIRRRLFEELASGATLRGLAHRLTLEGIATPSGRNRRWQPATIRMLVSDPICWGPRLGCAPSRSTMQRMCGHCIATRAVPYPDHRGNG